MQYDLVCYCRAGGLSKSARGTVVQTVVVVFLFTQRVYVEYCIVFEVANWRDNSYKYMKCHC